MTIFKQFYDGLMATEATQRDEEILQRYTLPAKLTERDLNRTSVV
jgi:hypothetical protein